VGSPSQCSKCEGWSGQQDLNLPQPSDPVQADSDDRPIGGVAAERDHRHSGRVPGHKRAIGLEHDGRLVSIAAVRTVARLLHDL
jgi:hypothetical protein